MVGRLLPGRLSYDEANRLLREQPELFKEKVQQTLKRHAAIVNKHTSKGTYFFDYGNAFLLRSLPRRWRCDGTKRHRL